MLKLVEKDGVNSLNKNLDERPCFSRLINFFENQCNITKPFYQSKTNPTKFKLRSLNSNERSILFKKLTDINVGILFPEIDRNTSLVLNYVFKYFIETIYKIKHNEYNITNIEILKSGLIKWLGFFVKLLPANEKQITPYIHCFVFHMPEFILNFKEINLYNLQCLEKLNDFATQIYHSATNKHKLNKSFIIQMIRKRNRLEFFELNGKENDLIQ